jgi:antitoxin YefM
VNSAVYHDRYQRTPDGWEFTVRVHEVRYLDTTPLAARLPPPRRSPLTRRGVDETSCAVRRALRSVYSIAYTSRMAKHVPVREFRSRLSELLDDVAVRRDHILVTRNGRPAAALVPIDEYQALEETAEILSNPDAIAAIEAGLAELNRGDTVTLEALRAELAERRRAL